MKIAYGMNRSPSALQALGVDRIYADHDGSARRERAALFMDGLRPGDVVVLMARGDLGVSKEIGRFEAMATNAKASIVVVTPEVKTPKPTGPKPTFTPTPEQRQRVADTWQSPWGRREALAQIETIMGRPITAAVLNRHIGPRTPKPIG